VRYGSSKRLGLPAILFAGALTAQPKFEVVSIRPVPLNTPPTMREIDFSPILPGGQFVDSRTGLLFLISLAYSVTNPSLELVGLPKWAETQSYSVSAKPAPGFPSLPPAENAGQVRLMLQSMLEDRFHLRLHNETRQGPLYRLEVARGGVKVKEVEPPVPPAREGPVGAAMSDDNGRMIGKKSTMEGIAKALVIFLKSPVIDQTGRKGYYDFDVKWVAPILADGQRPGSGFGTEGAGLLISNLQEQMGLRLTRARGPVEYWVVDHVEQPTEN
jgi:uncharacterized protein (TIGR03435 family)